MRISASVVLASFTLLSCDQIILRQPSLGQPDARVMAEDVNYEVTLVPLSPDVVSRANQSPFRQLVVLGGNRGAPARLVEPKEAIQRNAPPVNRQFEYVLGTGDILRLNRLTFVTDADGKEREETISLSLEVAEGGYVELADGQQVSVGGLTLEQARLAITAALIQSSESLASEVIERILPSAPAPEYTIGVGDVLAVSRLARFSEDGEFTERLVTRSASVNPNGTINILDIGAIEVVGQTAAQLKDTIEQEALRAGVSSEILVDIQDFNSKSALLTGDLGTQLIPITLEPLTLDRLLVGVNPNLGRERDYLIQVERGSDIFQMRARRILMEDARDLYPVLDGDRITIKRLAQLPSFQLSVADFRAQIVTFTGVGESDANEISLTNQGLDLRRLLGQIGKDADRSQYSLIRLFRHGREYRLSAQEILLEAPGNRYWLMPDDHIVIEDLVYTRNKALILGTVSRPVRLPIDPIQRTTLSEALFGDESQPSQDADFGHIYVLRGQGLNYTAYHLDLRAVLRAGLAEQFELRPGDIIFVRKRPISKFNEALRMALGLVSGVTAAANVGE